MSTGGGFTPRWWGGGVEKLLHPRYILKVELRGFPDGLLVYLLQERSQEILLSFGLKQLKGLSAIKSDGLGGKIRFQLGHFLIYLLYLNRHYYISISHVETVNES